MAHLLGAEALHLEFPTRVVFDSVSLGVAEGDRIGIVGRNGDGKSSLLAMLAGRLEPDAGQVTVRGGVRIGVLDQGDTLDDALTIRESIVGDTPEHEWAGEARIRDVISGLVGDLDWDGPVTGLSGGQRRRVALAALLAGDWDVLALDDARAQTGSNLDHHEHTHEVPRDLADRHVVGRRSDRVRMSLTWPGCRRPVCRAPRSRGRAGWPAGTGPNGPYRGRSGSLVAESRR